MAVAQVFAFEPAVAVTLGAAQTERNIGRLQSQNPKLAQIFKYLEEDILPDDIVYTCT